MDRHGSAACLKKEMASLLEEWVTQVTDSVPAAQDVPRAGLFYFIPVTVMDLAETLIDPDRSFNAELPRDHAILRCGAGACTLDQMMEEYFLLQTAVVERLSPLDREPRSIIERFFQRTLLAATKEFCRIQEEATRDDEIVLAKILGQARCILLSAEVTRLEEGDKTRLKWIPLRFDLAAAKKILPLDSAPGEDFFSAWRRSRQPPENEAYQRAIQTMEFHDGDLYPQEFRIVDRHGRERWMYEEVSVESLDENRWRIVGLITDVTEKRKAEEEIRKRVRQQEIATQLSQLALEGIGLDDLMQEAVVRIVDTLDVDLCKLLELLPDGKALTVRAGLGWGEGVVGETIIEVNRNSQADYLLQTSQPVIVDDLPQETRFQGTPLLRAHGAISGISVAVPGDAQPWGVLEAYSTTRKEFSRNDIHFIQAIANVLAAAIERKRLEDHLRQRAAELEEAGHYKDQFLAVLGHELRNPLGAMTNTLFFLRHREKEDEKVAEACRRLERQLAQMMMLVDEIRDVTRLRREKLSLQTERTDLKSVVERSLEAMQPMIEEQGHSLTVCLSPHPLPILADSFRLDQAVTNLLDNAIKYTEPRGQINVITAQCDGKAVLTIRDTGIGIDATVISRIFDYFVQADQTLSNSQGGLGIGLALVKGLVELHGGEVSAYSDGPGKGSQFKVALPLAMDEQEATLESRE